jgi:hypothetical protein
MLQKQGYCSVNIKWNSVHGKEVKGMKGEIVNQKVKIKILKIILRPKTECDLKL